MPITPTAFSLRRPALTKRQTARDPYGGRSPREIPAYDIFSAAHYLRIPDHTVRNWAYGYPYAKGARKATTKPLFDLADPEEGLLSFANLIEVHVLGALRREHKLEMKKIRRAIEWLTDKMGSPRPLLEESMETDGTDVFVTKLGKLINASQDGQLAMKELLKAHLRRIERDELGLPIRLFPFTWSRGADAPLADAPRVVSIDPQVAFGRPVIAGSRVPTSEVWERFGAGEDPDDLAYDFHITPAAVWEAIRCEAAL